MNVRGPERRAERQEHSVLRWLPCAVLFCLACASGRTLAQSAVPRPLGIDEALGARDFGKGDESQVSLSPDGQWVAYTVVARRHIARHDGAATWITSTGASQFVLDRDVCLTDIRSGVSRRLGSGTGTSWGATWSPDGSRLAFFSDRGGVAHAWLWERRTGKLREIGGVIVHAFYPTDVPRWTPDGATIVFEGLPRGESLADAMRRTSGEGTGMVGGSGARRATVRVLGEDGGRGRLEQSGGAQGDVTSLVAVDVASGSARWLASAGAIGGYALSPTGREIAYVALRTTQASIDRFASQALFDIMIVGVAGGPPSRVVSAVPQLSANTVTWSPDGSALAYCVSGASIHTSGSLPSETGNCYVVPTRTGLPHNLTPGAIGVVPSGSRGPLWSRDGRRLYVVSRDTLWAIATDSVVAMRPSVVPGREILDIVARVDSGVPWSDNGSSGVYVWTRDPRTMRMGSARIDLLTGEGAMRVEEDSKYALGATAFDAIGDCVAYIAQSAQHGPDIWLATRGMRHTRRLTHINPRLDAYQFGASRLVQWTTASGDSVRGALFLPAGYQAGRRYPLIVLVYGGVMLSSYVNSFDGWSKLIADAPLLSTRGYAVFYPDTPLRSDEPLKELGEIVLPGIDRLIELGIADPERLGVIGHSYGGYSALALIVQTGRFKAAVSVAGFSNLLSQYGYLEPDGTTTRVGWAEEGQGRMGGSPWQHLSRYLANSPFFHLERVTTPVLLVHGTADHTVPPRMSDETYVALRRLGKTVLYAKYIGEGHAEWSYANARDYAQRMLDWFDRYLMHNEAGAVGSIRRR